MDQVSRAKRKVVRSTTGRRRPGLALGILAGLLVACSTASAARVLVLDVRQAAPGVLGPSVARQADVLVWQRLAALDGLTVVTEGEVAASLGAPWEPYRTCASDECAARAAYLVGAEQVVWALVERGASGGLTLILRSLAAARPGLLGLTAVQSPGGTEAELLSRLMTLDPTPLALGGRPADRTGALSDSQASQQGVGAAPGWPAPSGPTGQPMAFRGRLRVISTPPGATVTLDGTPLGPTPLDRKDVPAGVHRLQLRLDADHEQADLETQVLAGRQETVKVTLRPSHGLLKIESTPAGALVLVNGQSVGRTPLPATRVPLGIYDIVTVLDGYAAQQKRVVVKDLRGQTVRFRLVAVRKGR